MIRENVIDHLFNIFVRHGTRSYQGGGVSMAEHMLQTAAAAGGAGAAPHLVAAALLHDVGHFSTDFVELETDPEHVAMLNATIDRRHEEAGAQLLQPFFRPDVVEPIRLHVQAKRYLCAVEHDYIKTLSPQALHTLNLQGGPMSPEEATAFEANPHGQAAAIIRRWDDTALVPGLKTQNFEHYRSLLESLLRA
ncbi:MAG: HD domain-containing protein [Acidiferrobacterales bacterium]